MRASFTKMSQTPCAHVIGARLPALGAVEPAHTERQGRPGPFLLEASHIRQWNGADKHRPSPPRDDAAVVHGEGSLREGLPDNGAAPQETTVLRGHPCPASGACALRRAVDRGCRCSQVCLCLAGRRLSFATFTSVPRWTLTAAGDVSGPVGPATAAEVATWSLPVSALHGVGFRAAPAAGAEVGRVGPPSALHVTPVGFRFLG